MNKKEKIGVINVRVPQQQCVIMIVCLAYRPPAKQMHDYLWAKDWSRILLIITNIFLVIIIYNTNLESSVNQDKATSL